MCFYESSKVEACGSDIMNERFIADINSQGKARHGTGYKVMERHGKVWRVMAWHGEAV